MTRRVQELSGESQSVVSNHTGDIQLDRLPLAVRAK